MVRRCVPYLKRKAWVSNICLAGAKLTMITCRCASLTAEKQPNTGANELVLHVHNYPVVVNLTHRYLFWRWYCRYLMIPYRSGLNSRSLVASVCGRVKQQRRRSPAAAAAAREGSASASHVRHVGCWKCVTSCLCWMFLPCGSTHRTLFFSLSWHFSHIILFLTDSKSSQCKLKVPKFSQLHTDALSSELHLPTADAPVTQNEWTSTLPRSIS